MVTQTLSDRREHMRSVGVTALSALIGVAAALASWLVTSGMAPATAAQQQLPVLIVLGAILIQLPLYTVTDIYTEDEVGPKHYLFIAFMTFSLWFVTWGILLSVAFTLSG